MVTETEREGQDSFLFSFMVSAPAAGDGGAAAGVGVGLGAGAAVVVRRPAAGARYAVPAERVVADVPRRRQDPAAALRPQTELLLLAYAETLRYRSPALRPAAAGDPAQRRRVVTAAVVVGPADRRCGDQQEQKADCRDLRH